MARPRENNLRMNLIEDQPEESDFDPFLTSLFKRHKVSDDFKDRLFEHSIRTTTVFAKMSHDDVSVINL